VMRLIFQGFEGGNDETLHKKEILHLRCASKSLGGKVRARARVKDSPPKWREAVTGD